MSALVTLGGLDVLSGRFSLPLSGISSGDVELGDDQLDLGPTELVFAGDGEPSVAFAVCVSAVADVEGRVHASIVGGRSGGLSRSALAAEAPGLHYDGDPTPVSTWELLSDLAELAGEAIDADQMAALQAFTALSWLREAGQLIAPSRASWGIGGFPGVCCRAAIYGLASRRGSR